MDSGFSELSLALIYLLKVDKANDLRIMAESFEESADRFLFELACLLGSPEAAELYIKKVVDDYGDLLR